MVNGRSRRTRWPTTRNVGVHNLASAGTVRGRLTGMACTAQSRRLAGAGVNGSATRSTAPPAEIRSQGTSCPSAAANQPSTLPPDRAAPRPAESTQRHPPLNRQPPPIHRPPRRQHPQIRHRPVPGDHPGRHPARQADQPATPRRQQPAPDNLAGRLNRRPEPRTRRRRGQLSHPDQPTSVATPSPPTTRKPQWTLTETRLPIANRSSLSAELAPHGIRVVGLRPHGIPETATMRHVHEQKAAGVTYEQFQAGLAGSTHPRRAMTLGEVAGVAAFLASDRASGLTGTTVNLTMGSLDD